MKIETPEHRAHRLALKKAYREANKERLNSEALAYYHNNKERLSSGTREYHRVNKEQISKQRTEYRRKNRDAILRKRAAIRATDEFKEKAIAYREQNKEAIKRKRKSYRIRTKELSRVRQLEKRKSNPVFKFRGDISTLIRNSFSRRSHKKNSKTVDILGCSIPEFKEFIESKFEPWMNWDNRGKYNSQFNFGWDLDHIIPITSANTFDEVVKLNHYTNFQPLCSRVNRFVKRNITPLPSCKT